MSYKKYNRRNFIRTLGSGCASVGLTTTLSGIANMGLLNVAAAANTPIYAPQNDYKALVCIALAGGNDSFNMLAPRGTSEYQQYAEIRTDLAIPQNDLLPINPLNVSGKEFGLHPSLPNVQSMFEGGDLAFIANAGALVAPTTLTSLKRGESLPLGLYSHSHQITHWQTSVAQDTRATGWGGRLADILQSGNANQNISMNISLNGFNTFHKANLTTSYNIENSGTGSVLIDGSENNDFYNTLKRQTLDDILGDNYQSILQNAYASSVLGAKSNSIEFSTAVATAPTMSTVFQNNSFGQSLEMVAKVIGARNVLNVSRQTFFVLIQGFDTHDTFLETHSSLMNTVDQGLKSLHDAFTELGVLNDVTTFTISDFGRKLISNGKGSDHAWGGNSIVMGGGVDGRKIYGEYPELYIGNSLDTGDGRFIPTTSCDEIFADLALWFGVSASDINQILPNINNFWTPTGSSGPLGIMV